MPPFLPVRCFSVLAAIVVSSAAASASQVKVPFVRAARDGSLAYTVDAQGNRVPDFSAAGYRGGGEPLPQVAARVSVAAAGGDAGGRIQAALDYVASLPADANGFRGAVVLAPGRYEVAKPLRLNASGVVLRGTGTALTPTLLVATATDRRPLIEIRGTDDRQRGVRHVVTDAYVPVGGLTLNLDQADGFRVGDALLIERPSTREWLAAIGMNDAPARQAFAWAPGKMDIVAERRIVALAGTRVTLDAPITTALDRAYGGASVTTEQWPGRLHDVGVENLRCESAFDPANPKDEQHAWIAIALDGVENAWVANVTAVHFASSAVQIGAGARAVTVQDCASLAPVSEIGGYRRHSFHTSGQLTLFVRCRTEKGIHDFTTGYLTPGPNVFFDCRADEALGASGSIGSWSSGVLFDNVHIDGAGLSLDNLETWNQGVGWSAANSMLWQCSASVMAVRRPPTAQNWAVGVWAEFLGDGGWDQVNEFVLPGSLYQAQLAARRGERALSALKPRSYSDDLARIPPLEKAVPDLASRLAPKPPSVGNPLALVHGWLVANGALLAGKPTREIEWWRGLVIPTRAPEFGVSLTRFVPGQTGPGFTDDLNAVTDAMVRANEVVLRHHYGLWYDRRRMDHERVRRATPDDWPPFFEQPFARSGQGEAWDRMSRYDLTKYNTWYFGRLHEFAELGREKGLVLVNEMYFQHNILEAGAHWVDCPWRPANCLQPTGFPEPPPFTDNDGDQPATPDLGKRIFMAEAFYDASNPVRRPLHRAFIRHSLEVLADEPNVIHTLTAENSGPLSFMQFWLDTVAEWEHETGRHPLIALSAPKDVQDAILSDPKRAAVVDVIDFTYWWRTDGGTLFAPPGGTTLAARQHEREFHGGRASPASLAEMAGEYRRRFPEKAIITSLEQGNGWLFAAAGGSLPKLPPTTDGQLKAALPRMSPIVSATSTPRVWVLGEADRQYFVAAASAGSAKLTFAGASGSYEVRTIDPVSGTCSPAAETIVIEAGKPVTLLSRASGHGPGLWWLVKTAR